MAAAGHGAGVALHATYERGANMSGFPNGAQWQAAIERVPERERHLALHEGHLISLTERDATVVDGPMLKMFGLARTASEWRTRLTELESAGATEIAYQPAGPDIPGELERFAAAAGL
jgi:5,10-methylenetetrahydromethanopterin reductase